jgi:23S rRNA-/tRNA-specific pseudouridylate synthase
MVIAKTDACHNLLKDMFANREVDKIYYAIVVGNPPNNKGNSNIINEPIGNHYNTFI